MQGNPPPNENTHPNKGAKLLARTPYRKARTIQRRAFCGCAGLQGEDMVSVALCTNGVPCGSTQQHHGGNLTPSPKSPQNFQTITGEHSSREGNPPSKPPTQIKNSLHEVFLGCTPRGSCNRTLLRRVLRRFSHSKCFLEGFLEGACQGFW